MLKCIKNTAFEKLLYKYIFPKCEFDSIWQQISKRTLALISASAPLSALLIHFYLGEYRNNFSCWNCVQKLNLDDKIYLFLHPWEATAVFPPSSTTAASCFRQTSVKSTAKLPTPRQRNGCLKVRSLVQPSVSLPKSGSNVRIISRVYCPRNFLAISFNNFFTFVPSFLTLNSLLRVWQRPSKVPGKFY